MIRHSPLLLLLTLPAAAASRLPDNLQYASLSVELPMTQKTVFLRAAETLLPRLAARTTDWAIVLDVDETVLNNYEYSARAAKAGSEDFDEKIWDAWVKERKATAIPGAKAFLDRVREAAKARVMPRGRIVFITNRRLDQEADTRANLAALGLLKPEDALLTLAGKGDTKDVRRACVALGASGKDARCPWAPAEIVALLGDSFRDFFELYGDDVYKLGRPKLEACVDAGGCYVVPNPLYGQWQSDSGTPYAR